MNHRNVIALLFFVSIFTVTGCGSKRTSVIAASGGTPSGDPLGSPAGAVGQNAVTVIQATSDQCSNGGAVITYFIDSNLNGQFDASEAVISSTPICNGADGADGNSAGVQVAQAAPQQCLAGGISIATFVDDNSNGILDSEEVVTSMSTLCDGLDGANGASFSFSQIQATVNQCPAGGVVLKVTEVDGSGDAVSDSTSTSIICNGVNGANGVNGINGVNGNSYRISRALATVNECPDGGFVFTITEVDPRGNIVSGSASESLVCNGSNGLDGADGVNGNSFSVSQSLANQGQCQAGGTVYTFTEIDGYGTLLPNSTATSIVCNGSNGIDGTNGTDGTDGADGINGIGVVFTTVSALPDQCPNGGNVIVFASDTAGTGIYSPTDDNQQSVIVCNGAQGPAGPVSPFSAIHPITPCGPNSSPWKEVLLCMPDGKILGSFSANMNGDLTRLSFITQGQYINTDSSGCTFSVSEDGRGGNIVSWSDGRNSYSTWSAQSVDCVPVSY